MRIRNFVEADNEKMKAMFNQYPWDKIFFNQFSFCSDDYKSEYYSPIYILSDDNDEMLGWICSEIKMLTKKSEISEIYVSPLHRNKWWAKMLIDYVISEQSKYMGIEYFEALVSIENESAKKLFESLLFQNIASLPNRFWSIEKKAPVNWEIYWFI